MNILITAIGSMSAEIVIKSLKKGNYIVGTDIYPKNWIATALYVDNFYQIITTIDNSKYIDSLLAICKREKINCLIPLTDIEIDVLNKNRDLFKKEKIILCISSYKTISIARNKLNLFDFFRYSSDVKLIPTFSYNEFILTELAYPIIAKPNNGRSSEGIFKMFDSIDFEYFTKRNNVNNYIFQPFYSGDIYTVDYIRNQKTNDSFCIERKELLRTLNGAGLTIHIINNDKIKKIAYSIGEAINVNGCVNFEFIHFKNEFYLMDINPRFSAGIAFSVIAGYDFINNHIKCFINQDIDTEIIYSEKTIAKRYYEIITN